MPDNPKGPEQDLMPAAQPETGQGAAQGKPLTREDVIELLTGVKDDIKKQYEGLRSVTDKRFSSLQQQFQMAQRQALSQQGYDDDDGQGGTLQFDYGTDSDRLSARAAVKMEYQDFDFNKVQELINDPIQGGRFWGLRPDGRTIDWVGTYAAAQEHLDKERAREILAKEREREAEQDALRAQQKQQAVISGSGASYPEGVKIPQTKEEARQMSDQELAEAMAAQFDFGGDAPDFVRENISKE